MRLQREPQERYTRLPFYPRDGRMEMGSFRRKARGTGGRMPGRQRLAMDISYAFFAEAIQLTWITG